MLNCAATLHGQQQFWLSPHMAIRNPRQTWHCSW